MMDFNWDDPEDDLNIPAAGPSFVERARNAPDDDDDDIRLWGGGADAPAIIPQDTAEETSLQKLIRYWMNERHAPDILPAQEMLLGRLLDHIRKQSGDVQLLRADPDSSEDEHFRIMLVQTEIERVKFVIRSYMRTRLHKIEKYAKHISMTEDLHRRLSKGELEHAETYSKLVDTHFTNAVLQSLPHGQQQVVEEEMPFIPSPISRPDLTRPVFAHARQACPPVRLPDGSTMEMEKGQISLTPYEVVEQLLLRDEVELV
ncbi:GINS complex Sld5 component [Irpex lacteus]|nr:GINS complex Sld5 component [Irpex lacteus]